MLKTCMYYTRHASASLRLADVTSLSLEEVASEAQDTLDSRAHES
jgi:hypothetical protein